MKILLKGLLIVLMTPSYILFSQEKHEHPDHPKGNNSNDQYNAIPLYNEACELYKNGRIEGAKKSLYEAINISFSLTEAQLFLGKIFYDQGQIDSALLYLNSGVDFAVEQDPHHYFYLFETGLKMEEYGLVKHNLKHFKKLYKHVDQGQYEKEYPFIVDDFERYDAAIGLIYDYQSWEPKSYILDTLDAESEFVAAFGRNIFLKKRGKGNYLIAKKSFKKGKSIKMDLTNVTDVQFSERGNYAFATIGQGSSSDIYFSERNGKKWSPWKKIEGDINSDVWDGDAFFYEKMSLLYFSSNRGGNKDIYVAKLNLENGVSETAINVERINTKYDEIQPQFVNDNFYFSSNGLPGFGGFDLFYTEQYWIEKGILQPSDFFNMGKPYNTGKDELDIQFLENSNHIVSRLGFKGSKEFVLMKYLPKKVKFDFDIKIQPFTQNAD